MKIIVNRSAASFKGIEHELMAVLEIVPIELKFIHGGTSRMAIPTIRKNYATVIPKQSLYSSHIPSDHINWFQPQPIVKGSIIAVRRSSLKQNSWMESTARSRLPYD
jgi:hypothetical protein